jgi:hypothetical protein
MQHLGHFRADHDHGVALRRQVADQVVDLGLGADVDAARRFVHDQHLGVHRQPFADDDLLLVAARQVARPAASSPGCGCPACRDTGRRSRSPRRRPRTARRSGHLTCGRVMLSRQFMPSTSPCSLRSSGTSEMPAIDGVHRRGIAPPRRPAGSARGRVRAGRTGSRRSRCGPRRPARRSRPPRPAHLEADILVEMPQDRPRTSSATSPSSWWLLLRLRSSLRPIIIWVTGLLVGLGGVRACRGTDRRAER